MIKVNITSKGYIRLLGKELRTPVVLTLDSYKQESICKYLDSQNVSYSVEGISNNIKPHKNGINRIHKSTPKAITPILNLKS